MNNDCITVGFIRVGGVAAAIGGAALISGAALNVAFYPNFESLSNILVILGSAGFMLGAITLGYHVAELASRRRVGAAARLLTKIGVTLVVAGLLVKATFGGGAAIANVVYTGFVTRVQEQAEIAIDGGVWLVIGLYLVLRASASHVAAGLNETP